MCKFQSNCMSHFIAFSFLLHKFSSSNIYISIQPATSTKQHDKTDISKQIKSQYICHGRCKVIIEINSSSVNIIQFCRFYHRNILANFYIICKYVVKLFYKNILQTIHNGMVFLIAVALIHISIATCIMLVVPCCYVITLIRYCC